MWCDLIEMFKIFKGFEGVSHFGLRGHVRLVDVWNSLFHCQLLCYTVAETFKRHLDLHLKDTGYNLHPKWGP